MRPRLDNRRWAARVPEILAGLLGGDAADLHVVQDDTSRADLGGPPDGTFVIEPTKSSSVGPVAAAAGRVRERAARMQGDSVPLVAVLCLLKTRCAG